MKISLRNIWATILTLIRIFSQFGLPNFQENLWLVWFKEIIRLLGLFGLSLLIYFDQAQFFLFCLCACFTYLYFSEKKNGFQLFS